MEYVQLTSQHKGEAIIKQSKFDSPTIILTCDTIISCNGEVFEKPMTKERQREFFWIFQSIPGVRSDFSIDSIQSGKDNRSVYRSFHFKIKIQGDKYINDAYIESKEGLEVAGGFKYQGLGCLLFDSMEGDYFNVVGLPVKVFSLLEKAV